jgi:acyl-CoA synthetase (NDP forming)
MQAMLDAARPSLLRIVGPNCLGVMAPHAGINASFAHLAPLDGDIAFVTQSGAVATSVRTDMKDTGLGYGLMSQILEYARSTGIGRVFGDVLKENDRMLRMAREFGFAVLPAEEGSDTVTVEISLATPAADAASAHARSLRRRRE